ncbi:MAG: aminoacyltransferase, partial [Patescibacteria group bacterium]|nr:aminoacyltransferase [Patescibacteria group bacterium]
MVIKDITDKEKEEFNKLVNHPLQSYEWGEFRKKTGIKVIRKGFFEKEKLTKAFQITIHKIPHSPWNIGYFPKGDLPDDEILNELRKIGKEEKCIFIQIEPNIEVERLKMKDEKFNSISHFSTLNSQLKSSFHPLFTKYTFILDLTKSEEELLKNMNPKTRYNIKVAQKHNVKIIEDSSLSAFEEYLKLTDETTKRQNFYAHSQRYHRLMWETLGRQKTEDRRQTSEDRKPERNKLRAHLLLAKYNPPSSISSAIRPPSSNLCPLTLVAWVVFVFKDTLYYPYGASSTKHRETMASNLMMCFCATFM